MRSAIAQDEGRAPVRRHIPAGNGPWRWGRLLAAAGLAGLSLCGCVTWDEMTCRDFRFPKDMWAKPPDPLFVLRDSKDGDKRAKAFRALKEPKLNGGSEQDQDTILAILATAAKQEASYYARLEAMRKLGEFEDIRAVPALIEAYYQADSLRGKDGRDHTVSKELISTFRCEVLRGLGNQGHTPAGVTVSGVSPDPIAIELLVRVLKQGQVKGPEEDVRMVLDERIAAARALKSYPQSASVEALLLVLKNDKDVALRDCATESLQACTGKKLPNDYATWDDYLHHQQQAPKKEKGFMDLILTGFGGKP
jgi:PBS lyase HEAT-like repeat